jgi:hypothetical protein
MKPDDVQVFFCFIYSSTIQTIAYLSLNNCVPSFIVAADPQATPQRITSFRLCLR